MKLCLAVRGPPREASDLKQSMKNMPEFSGEHKMEAVQRFVCICWWALWELFINQRSLCLLLLLFCTFTLWCSVADSAHTMTQFLPNRALWFTAPRGAASPCTPVRWGRAVARTTCPSNRASCRLATSMGSHCRSGAMGSSGKQDVFLKDTWEEVTLAQECVGPVSMKALAGLFGHRTCPEGCRVLVPAHRS